MKVEVVPYNTEWAREFKREAAELTRVFGDERVAIHHIGSTSVPGLQAKPIIDIMPVVRDIDRVDALNPQMEALGYEAMGEFGIPGRRYFRKGGDDRTHHVHVFQEGSGEIERHLAFRDYLRAHPDVAARYGELKAQLARQFPRDIEAYMDGKDAFVKEVERQALVWHRRGSGVAGMELVAYDRAKVDPERVRVLLADAVFHPAGDRLDAILGSVYSLAANKLFLLTDGGQIVGLVGIRRVGDAAAEILHIAVDEGIRQHGIGRRMIDELLKAENLAELLAETDEDAVGFYRRYGFAVRSLGEKYPGTERFFCSLRRETTRPD